MQQTYMISLMTADRPGVVEKIADAITRYKGNWLESRLVRLGGQFAGVISLQVATEDAADLVTALEAFNGSEMQLTVTPLQVSAQENTQLVHFNVVANDRPGIVQELSSVFSAAGANLEELATDLGSTPWSGEALFEADALVALPEGVTVEALIEQLEALADDLMVEVNPEEG